MAAEGNKYPIAVVIEAIDRMTGPVAAMNARLAAATQPLKSLESGFRGVSNEAGGPFAKQLNVLGRQGRELMDWTSLLAQETGLPRLGGALKNVGKAASEVGVAVKEASMAFLELGVAGYGIERIVEGFADYGVHAEKLSKQLGLSTDGYQVLAYAAKRSEIDQEAFDKGLQKLNTHMVETARGVGSALPVFEALGISNITVKKNLGNLAGFLPILADKLHGVSNAAVRAAMVQQLFGAKAAEFTALFEQGAPGLTKYANEAHRLGLVLDESGIKKAEAFHAMQMKLGAVFEGVRNELGEALTPALVKMGEALETNILSNHEAIDNFANGLANQLPRIATVVVGVLSALWEIGKLCATMFEGLSNLIGPTNAAFVVLAATVGRGTVVALFNLGSALVGVVPALIPVIANVAVLTGEFIAMAGAFLLTPWGLAIAGAAALGFAGYEVIKHWDKVKAFFADLWGWMKTHVLELANYIGDALGNSPLGLIMKGGAALGALALGPPAGGAGANADTLGKQILGGQNSTSTQNANVSVMFKNAPPGMQVMGTADKGMGFDVYSGSMLLGNL